MKKIDKVLVTGASGFIGSRLLKMLIENGYTNVRAVTHKRNLTNDIPNVEGNFEHFKGDLTDAEFCKLVSTDVDVVFHCAANTTNALDTKVNPLLHVTQNVEMNVNLMEQCWKNNVRKFMFISSNTVYPNIGSEYCVEEMEVQTPNIYPAYKAVGNMKRYGETLCDFLSNHIHNPMQCVIIRPSNAFGPNDKYDFEKCHVTPANIRKVADGLNPIPVWGDGTEVRDIIHVDDMVSGFICVAENVDKYDIYNVCYGSGYTVNEVLDTIKEIEGNNNPIEYVSNKAPMIPVRLLSNRRLKKLGWKPKYDLKNGLEDALNWYKTNKHLFNPNSKP
jgi:GDP-L-fucose synthase